MLWIVVCVLAVVLILIWLWKHVLVPIVAVATDKESYDRTEIVQISGSVLQDTTPLSGKIVKSAIQPPSGDAYVLPDATTDAEGKYAIPWEVPDDAIAGTYTLTVSCLGVSASKTFRQSQISIAVLRA